MHARHLLSLVMLLVVTGCGLGATSVVPSATAPTTASATSQKFIFAKLTASSTVLVAGQSSDLQLRISGEKPTSAKSVYWRCNGGQLNPYAMGETNTWTAPQKEGTYRVQADIVVHYIDGTSDIGTVSTTLRVTAGK